MRLFGALVMCCVLALSRTAGAATPDQTSASQPAPVDPQLIELALSAATDEARASLLAAHPEISVDPVRQAIAAAAFQRGTASDVQSGLNGFRTLLYAADRAGTPLQRMLALQGLGTLAGQRADFALAEPTLREALALAESMGNTNAIIVASNNLGIVQRLQGRFDDAIANYERTLAVAEKAGRRDSVARTLNNLGIVAQRRGDARAALDYLTRSLAIKEELGQTQELVTTTLNIGELHRYLGHFTKALEYFERTRDLAAKITVRGSLASALMGIGEVHMLEGRYAAAKDVVRQALDRAAGEDTPLRVADGWSLLGAIARYERQWAESEAAYLRSLEILESTGARPGATLTLTGLADLFLAQGQPERARTFAEQSVDVGRQMGLQTRWSALRALGTANAALGQTEAAIAALEESIEVVEQSRSRVAGSVEDLQRFFEDKTAPYYELASVYHGAGRRADAFAAVERARARVLLDVIDSGRPIVGALTGAERTREAELERDLVSLNVQRDAAAARTPPDQERIAALDALLDRARRERDEWRLRVYAARPDLQFGRGAAPAVTLDEAAAALAADTTVAVFMSGADRTRLLLLSKDGESRASVDLFTIPVTRDDIASRARAFNAQLARRDLGFTPAARALYDTLLGAADARLRAAARLVIVPDGALWDVPFQALVTPRGGFLIEERVVSYSPSVTTLARLEERRRARASGDARLVAIGNPAGVPRTLPEAAREVRSIAAMYGRDSRLFVGADATEERLRQTAPGADVLHVATHGELAPSSPMYSYVALGRTGDVDLSRDGRVEAWELANMPLKARLVVLSACETALGSSGAGEGVVGLSWSLFAAGAATTAVSLWRVDSASTTELMLAFHRALLDRRRAAGPADAMQTAAKTLLASPRYRHPFYWAGFVVIGAP